MNNKPSLAISKVASQKQGGIPGKASKVSMNKRSNPNSNPSSSRGRLGKSKEPKILEEEVKVPEKRRVILDRSQINIHSLNNEQNEIKTLVDNEIKSPNVKRRATLQNVTQLFQPKKIEQEDWEERQATVRKIEEEKQKKLEWRAQYKELAQVPPRREKSEVKKVEGDLIRIVHTEESEGQIAPRFKESFWEKIGFKDKKKQEKNLVEGKEKIDLVFKRLKDTIKKNHELKSDLDGSRQTIKDQNKKKEQLQQELEKQKKLLQQQEEQIEFAQREYEIQKSINTDKLTRKQNELAHTIQEYDEKKEHLRKEYELAQMRLEEKIASYQRVKFTYDHDQKKNEQLHNYKEESIILQEEEQQINQQLALSKPLVTEIMEYFNMKENESQSEEKLETLVEALQIAIEECLDAEQKFQKAAYYDANKFLPFERAQRSAYTEKLKFNQ